MKYKMRNYHYVHNYALAARSNHIGNLQIAAVNHSAVTRFVPEVADRL